VVVGANGQLGWAVTSALVEHGIDVRGSVRTPERGAGLRELGVEPVIADLAIGDGIRPHLDEIDALILTANTAAPRSGDKVRRFPAALLKTIDAAEEAGVRRFVLVSVPRVPNEQDRGYFDDRRTLEARLQHSSMDSVVLRFAPFMDIWLALAGSDLPLRGEPHATLRRPSPIVRRVRRWTGQPVDDKRQMLVPGDVDRPIAFISIADAARACVEAVVRDDVVGGTFEIGGPDVLTSRDVAEIFADVVGGPMRMRTVPTGFFGLVGRITRPFAPVTSETMRLFRAASLTAARFTPGGKILDPGSLTSVRDYLTAKAALPNDLEDLG
jgi:uncharacterized protein YbjT (DUF2867 family)